MSKKAKTAADKINGTFESIVSALRHGHWVRRSSWEPGVVLAKLDHDYRGRPGTNRLARRDTVGNWLPWSAGHDDIFALDWELAAKPGAAPATEPTQTHTSRPDPAAEPASDPAGSAGAQVDDPSSSETEQPA